MHLQMHPWLVEFVAKVAVQKWGLVRGTLGYDSEGTFLPLAPPFSLFASWLPCGGRFPLPSPSLESVDHELNPLKTVSQIKTPPLSHGFPIFCPRNEESD